MFGIFKKREPESDQAMKKIQSTLAQMGASVLLVTQSGKIVMVSDTLRNRSRSTLCGKVIEVMVSAPGVDPYFVYYENEEYYLNLASYGLRVSFSEFNKVQEYEQYRSNVSQAICVYLILYITKVQGKSLCYQNMSFSHNKIDTNVLAYVEKLNNWYPIQHRSTEPDSATGQKVAQVNDGSISITDVIAVHEPSPS